MISHKQLKGVFVEGKRLFTLSLAPGKKVYDEKTVNIDGKEYREWDISRSKLAAAITKGVSQIGIKPGCVVLYLGASYGTTVSHVSDIIGKQGFVFALDFAPRVVRDLVFVCEDRTNMAPILADANNPSSYIPYLAEVDVVYQDVAQRNQTEIFIKNIDMFLKKDGFALLCVKARSVDVTKRPEEIFKKIRAELEKKLVIVDYRELAPMQKDHCLFMCKKCY